MRKLASLFIIIALLSSCADDPNKKQDMGTILGGATGALVGSAFGGGDGKLLAIGVGAITGAFLGNQVGKSMDEKDAQKHETTAQGSLENSQSGQTSKWHNLTTGNQGSITPKTEHKKSKGYCREFTQAVVINGKTQEAYGTACRQPDGSWKIIQ